MDPLDVEPPQIDTSVHSLPNYVLAAGAIGIVLFAAGSFGIVVNQRGYEAEPPRFDQTPADEPSKKTVQLWIPYANLKVPDGMQVYSECGESDCGESTIVIYGEAVPEGLIRTNFPEGPTWPDLKITALSRSSKVVYLPQGVDMQTLEATRNGSYLRDRNRVYYFTCATYACGYNPLTGLDPATFNPETYAPVR